MKTLELVDRNENEQIETLTETTFMTMTIPQKTFTVTVVPKKLGEHGEYLEYSAIVTPSYFQVKENSMWELLFKIEGSPAGTVFQDPPVVFFGANAPALIIQRSDTQAKVLWSNMDRAVHGLAFDYRVRLRIGDTISVTHDPTVQNDPPPPPTLP